MSTSPLSYRNGCDTGFADGNARVGIAYLSRLVTDGKIEPGPFESSLPAMESKPGPKVVADRKAKG